MPDPYRMVFVSLISSLFLVLGVLTYRYIFPRKNVNLLVLLLLISALPIISILRPGTYESGDFNIHIYRIMAFYDSLGEGNIMPSWAGELNATYGNPLFIFNYSLPYYFISLFHFLGITLISSTKLYLGLSLYLSGIFMYLWIKKLTGNSLAAFTSSIFYVFAPYHLIDVHFRATLGESTIFTLVPLLLFFITSYFKKRKIIYLISTALVSQLLFLAHPMVAGVFLIISVFFALSMTDLKKRIKSLSLVILSLFIGAIGSVYAWSPFIIYSSYMPENPGKGIFQDTFSNIFYSPWRFGLLFQGPHGELAPIIGYTQISVVIFVIFILFTKKVSKKLVPPIVFWLIVFFSTLFFLSPLSKTFWLNAPFISMLQSNRLVLAIAVSTSALAGYLSIYLSESSKKKIFVYALLFITVGYTILNWGHRRVIPEINDDLLRKNVWASTVSEGTTAYFLNNRWADINDFWFTKRPSQHLEILRGKGEVKEIKRTSTSHSYVVNAKSPLTIKENTLYYPGWTLKSNSDYIPIYPGERGVINAALPEGFNRVEFAYSDIPVYASTKIISVTIFLVLVVAQTITFLREYKMSRSV